jgi:outer membrane protein OmpA-like peptidoglycan-associated protein
MWEGFRLRVATAAALLWAALGPAACGGRLPPPDTEGDGLTDDVDRCPDEAEDPDGFEDGDGCPDPDNDGDGIGDPLDGCPLEAEDPDGVADGDGCPDVDVDTDGDGVPDGADACPEEAEDADSFRDDDGCPDVDNDGDGIPDGEDGCPGQPEVVNGVEDGDGCPDESGARVEADRIVLEETVHFEFGTAVLRADSLDVLEDVARLLVAHPEYARVEIRGYTDYQGDEDFNLQLSQRRADRIRATLVRMGVGEERLTAVGMGEGEPIAEGTSLGANRENRRVEFVITEVRP